MIAVVGEAGIGKTRLLEELGAEAQARGGLLLAGRPYETEQILPFGPWVAALRRIAADREALADLAPAWIDELARLFPELRTRAEPPRAENSLRLFEAIGHWLGRLASRRPLLVLLDDVHWADQTSVRLLPFLARRLDGQPVCLAVTARAEETAGHPVLRAALAELYRDDRAVELPLMPLSREHTLGLMRSVVPGGRAVAEDVEERVWQTSGGNPLVVVEMARGLGHVALVSAGDLATPERMRRIVVERLARLSDEGRSLAATAAVIGRECDLALLQHASKLPDADVASAVEELLSRHVLRQVDGHFEFAHDRVREAVYGDLSLPRRRLLHAAVAAGLEALRPDDLQAHYSALVAHHRGAEDWGRALRYLRAAAHQAVARGAFREAVALFEDALRALDRLPPSREAAEQGVDVRIALRRTALAIGELSPPLRYLDEAERLARSIDDQHRLVTVYGEESHIYWLHGMYRRAVELGQRVLDVGEALRDPAMQGFGCHLVGKPYFGLGEFPRAIDHLERAASMLEGWRHLASDLGDASASADSWRAAALAYVGRFDEALALARDALAGAEAGQGFVLTWFTFLLGSLQLERGVLEPAVRDLEQARKLEETFRVVRWSRQCAAALACAYVQSGRIDDGLRLIDPGTDVPRFWGSHVLYRRGEALLDAGRAGEALPVAEAGLELAGQMEERGNEAQLLRLLGDVRLSLDGAGSAKAEECYRRGLALGEERAMRPLAAQCQLGLGRSIRARDPAEARERMTAALTTFRDLEMPLWLDRATHALAEVGDAASPTDTGGPGPS